jgi:integrase/recombinase XerC
LIGFPPLEPAEARRLLDSISTTTPAGLRDRALIGLMVNTFVRIGASLAKVEDVLRRAAAALGTPARRC